MENRMSDGEFFEALLDSLKDQFVFVDSGHIVRYMNKVAVAEYKRGEGLIGKSVLECHSERSRRKIMEAYDAIRDGAEEVLISDKKGRRVFMRAVRDKDGKLMGYYERYEHATHGKQDP